MGSRNAEFWPPVKRQKFASVPGEFVLRSSENVSVGCADSQLEPLLQSSGFRSAMEGLGFKINLVPSDQAKIRFAIEKSMAKQGYEIHVDSSLVAVTAGDKSGILYAMYTILQSIQLFSSMTNTDGEVSVSLPNGSIIDRPDVELRAVIVSHAEAAGSGVKDLVSLLSRLHVNEIHVQLDFESGAESDFSALLSQASELLISVVPVVTFSNTCGRYDSLFDPLANF